ncbi:MAG: antibiotic biosynthesis monooxygenase [Holdemanella sp.]|nr:antibiotic biosynthesis monooxygenase [Holdemanella sp.]
MSIVINIYYKGENGNARKFAKEMVDTGVVDRIKSEPGNIKYNYFYPVDDEETVLLIDEWENQQALDVHHATSMMQEITVLREKYDLHMKVERMIHDDASAPESDKQFIKK